MFLVHFCLCIARVQNSNNSMLLWLVNVRFSWKVGISIGKKRTIKVKWQIVCSFCTCIRRVFHSEGENEREQSKSFMFTLYYIFDINYSPPELFTTFEQQAGWEMASRRNLCSNKWAEGRKMKWKIIRNVVFFSLSLASKFFLVFFPSHIPCDFIYILVRFVFVGVVFFLYIYSFRIIVFSYALHSQVVWFYLFLVCSDTQFYALFSFFFLIFVLYADIAIKRYKFRMDKKETKNESANFGKCVYFALVKRRRCNILLVPFSLAIFPFCVQILYIRAVCACVFLFSLSLRCCFCYRNAKDMCAFELRVFYVSFGIFHGISPVWCAS